MDEAGASATIVDEAKYRLGYVTARPTAHASGAVTTIDELQPPGLSNSCKM